MPGNQPGSPDQNIELKVGYMVKRSQGKSTLGAINFKKRVFVLTPSCLSYFDGTLEKRGTQKGSVVLKDVRVVEKVTASAFEKPSFQIMHGDLTLYVIANNAGEQEEWISLLRQYCRENGRIQDFYHPGLFSSGKWSCCDHKSRHSYGCQPSFLRNEPTSTSSSSFSPPISPTRLVGGGGAGPYRGPLPPTPQAASSDGYSGSYDHQPPSASVSSYQQQHGSHNVSSYQHTNPQLDTRGGVSSSQPSHAVAEAPPPPLPRPPPETPKAEFEVIAMYNYQGLETGDLALEKGQRVIVFDSSREHWWRARNSNGREGFVPSNYVKKIGLDSEDWFFPTLSRTRAENILKSEGKEGTFVVRNSSRDQMYTLSICHEGQVRHYHIKQDSKDTYYISEKHRFQTITELIEYHKLNGGGLVTRLRRPPLQLVPNQPGLSSVFDSKWDIDKAELSLGKELGSGQFGRVVAGKWRNRIDVAVKMMKEGAMNEEDFIAEAQVMQKFQHENLVKLYGICTRSGPMYIVTELMVNGCLLQYLRHNKHLIEKTEIILDMAIQICSAMKFLEQNKFIHRDLAARNCLVGERNSVKVADFGLARFVVDDEYTASEGTKFPIKWAAPEVITHARFSSKSDVWSYAILLWELWSGGKTPYPAFTNPQVLDEVLIGYRLERPKHCPPEVYHLMWKSWLGNSDDRPSFTMLHDSLSQMAGDDYSETVDD